LAARATRQDC